MTGTQSIAGTISAVLLDVLTGCGSNAGTDTAASSTSSSPTGGTLTVYAASLKQTFTDIGEQNKTDHPGWSVEFTFAGSSDLVTQLTQGAKADAGLVYITDALGAGDKVAKVDFPEAATAVNTYPIAVLKSAADADAARGFVDAVTGEAGQKILSQAGFAKP
jgi:ABC-type molybdate transport system substrate-binding protein